MNKQFNTDYLKVAEKLYREANPKGTMDTPSSVYEKVEQWHKEWVKASMNNNTRLDLYSWIKKVKK
jgi:hypothetical protein